MVKDIGSAIKHFVLDTNVLLHNPNALFSFADNHVIIPFDVLEELDKFKKDSTDVGRSARTAIRHIDTLREKGHLNDGV
jgi:PhoH-like ATPase